jgi:hypothetical protein
MTPDTLQYFVIATRLKKVVAGFWHEDDAQRFIEDIERDFEIWDRARLARETKKSAEDKAEAEYQALYGNGQSAWR